MRWTWPSLCSRCPRPIRLAARSNVWVNDGRHATGTRESRQEPNWPERSDAARPAPGVHKETFTASGAQSRPGGTAIRSFVTETARVLAKCNHRYGAPQDSCRPGCGHRPPASDPATLCSWKRSSSVHAPCRSGATSANRGGTWLARKIGPAPARNRASSFWTVCGYRPVRGASVASFRDAIATSPLHRVAVQGARRITARPMPARSDATAGARDVGAPPEARGGCDSGSLRSPRSPRWSGTAPPPCSPRTLPRARSRPTWRR